MAHSCSIMIILFAKQWVMHWASYQGAAIAYAE
jgi:hypothetical protein